MIGPLPPTAIVKKENAIMQIRLFALECGTGTPGFYLPSKQLMEGWPDFRVSGRYRYDHDGGGARVGGGRRGLLIRTGLPGRGEAEARQTAGGSG